MTVAAVGQFRCLPRHESSTKSSKPCDTLVPCDTMGFVDTPKVVIPALRKATGDANPDVAREAANLVLLDDNFATIVAAVEEGRRIYDNTRKFIQYILASNTGELSVLLLAPMGGMPLPLFPLQILWINLVTDGLPALALGAEPAERTSIRPAPMQTASIS